MSVVVENAVKWSQKGNQRCEEVTEAACGSSPAPGTAFPDSPLTETVEIQVLCWWDGLN